MGPLKKSLMTYSLYPTNSFKKELKKLLKKYPSLKSDLEQVENELLPTPHKFNNLQ